MTPAVDRFILEALFITVTNVNFDAAAIEEAHSRAAGLRDKARALYEAAARKAGQATRDRQGPGHLDAGGQPGRPGQPGRDGFRSVAPG